MESTQYGHGTIQPATQFDSEADAKALRTAMKGLGTDEAAIIQIVANRSNKQRQEIKQKYKLLLGRNLVEDLHSELSGNLKILVLALMETKAQYDANCLYKAMKGLGTDESVLIEILCTRTNQEIRNIVAAYKTAISRDLEKDVNRETSGSFKRLLAIMCQGARDESSEVDLEKARREAHELYLAGENRWGNDESKFNLIIGSRSFPQLRATFDEYAKIALRDILSSIDREMSGGDLKKSLKTIVQNVYSRPDYFADRLYYSMKGLGTDDDTLIRVVVSRSEIDLVEIKQRFFELYHITLGKMIEGDTSGDYRKLLLAIVGPN